MLARPSPRLSLVFLGAATLVCGVPGPQAHAQPAETRFPELASASPVAPSRVVVVVRASSEEGDLAREARTALSARLAAAGARVVTAPPADVEPPTDDLEPALARAGDAFAHLRLEEARGALEALLAQAAARGGAGLTRASLVRARIALARVALALGDEASLAVALDDALAVEPSLALDPAEHPPALREALEARRASVVRCSLTLAQAPETATVWFDGAPLPEGAHEVACGLHLVRATAPGHRGEARSVRATPGETLALAVVLPLDVGGALASPGAPFDAVPEAVRAAARALDATPVVLDVAAAGADEVRLRLTRPDGARDARVALASLAAWIDASMPVRTGGSGEDATALAWGLGASGAALAVLLGVVLGVTLSAEPPRTFELRGQVLP